MSKKQTAVVVDDVLITYREAAERLGVSYSTVRRDVRDRKLPCVRVRGAHRIPASAVAAIVAGGAA